MYLIKEKSLLLTIQLYTKFGFGYRIQNRKSLTIQMSKSFKFGHRAVLIGGFKYIYLQLSH
jgi:hypothetical protein